MSGILNCSYSHDNDNFHRPSINKTTTQSTVKKKKNENTDK